MDISFDLTSYDALTGEAPGHSFGVAAVALGDLDGDGRGEVAVAGLANEGLAGVRIAHFDGKGLVATADLLAGGEWLRCCVALGAGDLDGDGALDLVAGGGPGGGGEIHVLPGDGAGGFDATPSLTLADPYPTGDASSFGGTLAAGGDLDGDGYGDLVVGITRAGQAGEVRGYRGGRSGLGSTAAWTLQADDGAPGFGTSVALLGDVNGDSLADLAVGAPRDDGATGSALLYAGGAGEPTALATLSRSGRSQALGTVVAPAGDANGDGYADTLVADPGDGLTPTVYVLLGGETITPGLALEIPCPEAECSRFAAVMAPAGDVDGDGYGEVLFGNEGSGEVLLYRGTPRGVEDVPRNRLAPLFTPTRYGAMAAGAGDLDGDGLADLLVGDPGWEAGGETGAAQPWLGGEVVSTGGDDTGDTGGDTGDSGGGDTAGGDTGETGSGDTAGDSGDTATDTDSGDSGASDDTGDDTAATDPKDGGCGCAATAGSAPGWGLAGWLVGLAALVTRRRA